MADFDFHRWPRKPHFELFKNMAQPYFSVCVQINAKKLYDYCKRKQQSFFYSYIHATLTACHLYEPMMLRIQDDRAIQLDKVRASVVELAPDDTFRFSCFSRYNDLSEFITYAQHVSKTTKAAPLFNDTFEKTQQAADLIHVSVLPWLNFSSFSHAFDTSNTQGIPKFVFGKYDCHSGCMPLAIDVHHSLLDGLHVAHFIKILQQQLDECF
ncbi:chloramphenicol acetyltransferase [Pseudoalteromonas sp. MMG010]|uniref:CatA-like O-acetyltransferase n=1 Tax=Pseudoalteromonas sp. MMG010 TaxID=2822685 RepID=UPI001B3A50E1|nr:CatA-like O-acetyltransferase [Pseudoalteromonas sp. MMG010]MBQ4833273.1 chloramphenicol acetyltransferase [Pseudoalteromonas sp. MMG010]